MRYTVKALAAIQHITIANLADHAGISANRLKKISASQSARHRGRKAKLTAGELVKLAKATNISPFDIDLCGEEPND